MRKTCTLAMVSLALLTTTGIGFAAEAQKGKWQFGVSVPLWAAGIQGDVTVQGVKSDLDVGFDDLWDHLDAAFSIAMEARKERFGISDDSSHFDWSAMGALTYDATKWLSLSAGYRALATNADDGSGSSKKGVDIIMHGLLLAAQLKF
jgi:hypothetical protein